MERSFEAYEQYGVKQWSGRTLLLMARYLKILHRDDDALEKLRVTLEMFQHIGSPLGIAQTLEEFGEICANRADYSGTREAYEHAQQQYESISGTTVGRRREALCRRNIIQLTQMENNPANHILSLEQPN
jgi:hypothetical protein